MSFVHLIATCIELTLSYRQIRAARRALEEDSGARRKRDAVVDLLKDVANKHTSLETSKGGAIIPQNGVSSLGIDCHSGLVIQEALYGVTDEKDGAQDLAIDVTTPMQALVRNSHLYIPGGKSKVRAHCYRICHGTSLLMQLSLQGEPSGIL